MDSGLVSSRQFDRILAKAMEQLFKGIDFMARTRAAAERLTSEPQVHSVNSVNSVNSVHSTKRGNWFNNTNRRPRDRNRT